MIKSENNSSNLIYGLNESYVYMWLLDKRARNWQYTSAFDSALRYFDLGIHKLYHRYWAHLIYMYIFILSSTDRLFRCIITLQCGSTYEMLQAGIESRLILHQSDILPQILRYSLRLWGNFFYVYIFLHVRYRLSGVLNSWEGLLRISSSSSRQKTHGGEKHIHRHPQTVSCHHNFSVWLDTRDALSWDRNPAIFGTKISFVKTVVVLHCPLLHNVCVFICVWG